jgi:PAS domain S-box-containing protein
MVEHMNKSEPCGAGAVREPPVLESPKKKSCSHTLKATSRTWLKTGDVMSKNVATVDQGCSVISAAKVMSEKNVSCLVVSNKGQLSGIVTETDMLKKAVAGESDFRKVKVEQIMSAPVRSVSSDVSVMEAITIMQTENIRRLVILEAGRPVGIVTQTDMVRILASYAVSREVREIMSSDVAVIESSASVKEAAKLMASQDISCLVAMDDDEVAGIFTERDLLKRVIAVKRNPVRTILKKVMSSPVVTVSPDCSIISAWKLLERIGIRRLVVIDDDALCGMVTQTDILNAIKDGLEEAEDNYYRLLSESEHCIFTIDLDLNTTYVNPAFMKLLQVTDPDELINKPFLPERFWDDTRERDRFLYQLTKASVQVEELRLKTAKGRKLSVILFSIRNKNIKGEISGSQGVLYDVTAKKDFGAIPAEAVKAV